MFFFPRNSFSQSPEGSDCRENILQVDKLPFYDDSPSSRLIIIWTTLSLLQLFLYAFGMEINSNDIVLFAALLRMSQISWERLTQ